MFAGVEETLGERMVTFAVRSMQMVQFGPLF